ncbi:MAG: hypothetical protein ACP5EP_09780 [Acidobacteriaceae bacterium]
MDYFILVLAVLFALLSLSVGLRTYQHTVYKRRLLQRMAKVCPPVSSSMKLR